MEEVVKARWAVQAWLVWQVGRIVRVRLIQARKIGSVMMVVLAREANVPVINARWSPIGSTQRHYGRSLRFGYGV